jgi:threonine aldolase
MDFGSDNWTGATTEVMAAIERANGGQAPAYGEDALTARATELFSDVFEREVAVHFVGTGTAANLLSLQAMSRISGSVLCSEQAHVHTDEFNGAEFSTGMKLIPVSTADGRITVDRLESTLAQMPPEGHRGPVAVLTLTNATEFGTTYSAAEVADLAGIAKSHGAAVHVDGARFANAVAATGDSPADLTWRSGVDLMSFGGTKNGCWAAEAIVVFDPSRELELFYLRHRYGHGISKQRFIAAQFEGYFADGAWLRTAAHANAMAARLAAGLQRHDSVRLEWAPASNELFPVMPAALVARLKAGGARFHTWETRGDAEMVRLVTSFETTAEEVDKFLALMDAT